MANNNYYGGYGHKKEKSGTGWKVFGIIVAILLVAVLVVSLLVTYRITNGWTEIPEFEDDVIDDDENVSEIDVNVVDEVGGISLLVGDVETLWSGNKVRTLTVSYNKDATDPLFVWEITEGDGQTVSITPSDDTLSCC